MTSTTAPAGHPLESGLPPRWADEWGEDRYGVFAGFRVGNVAQRLRWIPPGRFLMGSPENEAGRWNDEGPRHPVILTEGFWLADTPCTQGLWQAVTNDNPSEFRSPKRPVEKVSWEDCAEFLRRLGELVPGLEPRLPTEAQWEYACRVGTETATYAGDLVLSKGGRSPVLDRIAWYGGSEGSHEVASKEPSSWGLYDLLGNVWEWCSDWFGPYAPEAALDPSGPAKGSLRVFRGGSWGVDARFVRAACRYWFPPGSRDSLLGFRLSRGQARGAETPAEPVPSTGRPRRGTRR